MTSFGSELLESPVQGLFATPAARLPYQHNVLLRSYVLERPQGNVIVYNSPGVSSSANAIRALGAPTRLLINHGHEAMYGQPELDVPIWGHEKDHLELARSLKVTGNFRERTMIDHDLEVIPTPGHTAGTTSFLWNNGTHRFLFTGDFIWIEDGQWKAVVLDPALRGDYLASLTLARDLDFDVLVPWGTTEGGPSIGVVVDPSEKQARIDAIIGRVEAGGNR
ncbi:MBL fold metallo-hydrolase [Williamsia muralis]|uniref:MBL fold hydrolase n=1 Tax=Williamsia marianensis TaxID=85044 RepID=A0A2G3PT72_WILMA|nr:MBL fold metallo-hydrolase [Williamsia marianensis]PHV69068.1 MBL fold hydrolase [Williamsia marianensis]